MPPQRVSTSRAGGHGARFLRADADGRGGAVLPCGARAVVPDSGAGWERDEARGM